MFSSLVIRIATLTCRLLLVSLLATKFPRSDVGIYGVFVSGVTLVQGVLGLELYTHFYRNVARLSAKDCSRRISRHFSIILIIYAVAFPLGLFFALCCSSYSFELIFWFGVLLLLDHVSQEFFRFYIHFGNGRIANLINFFKSGFWVPFVAVFALLNQLYLWSIFLCWSFGSLAAILFAIWHLSRMNILIRLNVKSLQWKWVLMVVKSTSYNFIGSFTNRFLLNFDRIGLAYLFGTTFGGNVTLAKSIVGAIQALVDATVTPRAMARITKDKSDPVKLAQTSKIVNREFVLSWAVIGMALFIGIMATDFFVKSINLPDFYVMGTALIGGFFYTASLGPHYTMYLLKNDRKNFIIGFSSMVFWLLLFIIIYFSRPSDVVSYFIFTLPLAWLYVRKYLFVRHVLQNISPG